jgi:uncharacterized protein YutE (UPF0331/DUF86 family)
VATRWSDPTGISVTLLTPFDRDRCLAHLVGALGTERIDLVDLARASALLRFRAAGDGVVIHEARPGTFSMFWLQAVGFWCDMSAIIREGYDDILAELSRSTTPNRETFAKKVAAVERHLARVAARQPADPADLMPATDCSDAVILHLWQATRIVIDLAVATCLHLKLGAPGTDAEAFRRLADANRLDPTLAERLARAAGFRNVVTHAYERLDMGRVHRAAREGPADLRAFLQA